MTIIAILIALAGIATLCWLLFTLAVFALPLFAGITIGMWAYGTGAGILGSFIIAAAAAVLTFGLFQLLLLVTRSAWMRLVIVLAFVAPAAIAGYHATLGTVRLGTPSETWQVAFAVVGAIAVGMTAFVRLTTMAATAPTEHGVARAS